MECIVVGGGITGLAVAHLLRSRGIEPLLLEESERAGGKIRSDADSGFLCESGPTGFADREGVLTGILTNLGLMRRAVLAAPTYKKRSVTLGGRVVPVPTDPVRLAYSRLLPMKAKLRVLADLVLPRGPVVAGGDESVAAFARRRIGQVAANRIFFPLISGIYAGDPDAISLSAALPFFADLERNHRSLLLGLARTVSRESARPRLHSFPSGMEEIARSLASDLGARVRFRSRALGISRSGSEFRVRVQFPDGTEELSARSLVLSLPAHAAVPVVDGFLPGVARHLAAIPYVPVTLVYLGYDNRAFAAPVDSYGFLVGFGENSDLLGGVFNSTFFPGRAPSGMTLISARMGGARRPELAHLPDGAIVERAHAEMAHLLGIRDRPVLVKIIRHARALPQYTLGHKERVAAIEAAELSSPGVVFAGSAFRGAGVVDCVRDALRAAGKVAMHLGG
ncbi:MAG: protoporphyrinogen oxidase [Deltaproteobacteria bacterium]|nr:protoporphyrinogen oxidase [Deltaproteobacteria bacterium]